MRYAPFIYDAWNSPEILSIVSKIAQVALIPAMDFEIGHVNFSVKSEEQTQKEIDTIKDQKRFFNDDEGIAGCPWEDDKPVVGWHTDSYPFVCVLMLSDCTNMVGGETALQTGTGDIMKVRGPDMVGRNLFRLDLELTLIVARVVLLSCRDATSHTRHFVRLVLRSALPWSHLSVPAHPSSRTTAF